MSRRTESSALHLPEQIFALLQRGYEGGGAQYGAALVDRLRFDTGALRRARTETAHRRAPVHAALKRHDGPSLRGHIRALSVTLKRLHLVDLYLALGCALEHPEAASQVHNQYGPLLRTSIRKVIRNQSRLSEDEVYASLLQRLVGPDMGSGSHVTRLPRRGTRYTQARISRYLGQAPLQAWLRVVAKRIALDALRSIQGRASATTDSQSSEKKTQTRRSKARMRRETQSLGERPLGAPADEANRRAGRAPPQSDTKTGPLLEAVQDAWQQLAKVDQARLRLHHVWRLSNTAVALVVGENLSTTGRRLQQAREKLGRSLEASLGQAARDQIDAWEFDGERSAELLARIASLYAAEQRLDHTSVQDLYILRASRSGGNQRDA